MFQLHTASLLQAVRSIKYTSPWCCHAQQLLDGISQLWLVQFFGSGSLCAHLPCDSPAVVFLDCQHSGFWDLYSTVPVNVVRVKSYVNCPLHQSQAWNSIQSQLSRTAYQWHVRNQIHHLKKICSMNLKCCDPRPKWLHPETNNIALLINSHLLSLNTQKSPSFLFLDQSVILLFWTEQLIMLIWNCFLFPFPYLILLLMLVLPQVYQSTPWHKLPSLVLSLKVLHLKVQKALKKKMHLLLSCCFNFWIILWRGDVEALNW